jgi:hypothetical protein
VNLAILASNHLFLFLFFFHFRVSASIMPLEVLPIYLGHAMAELNKLADVTQKVTNAKV